MTSDPEVGLEDILVTIGHNTGSRSTGEHLPQPPYELSSLCLTCGGSTAVDAHMITRLRRAIEARGYRGMPSSATGAVMYASNA